MPQTELEEILAEATRWVKIKLEGSKGAQADLVRLLAAGQKPWIIGTCDQPPCEVLIQLNRQVS